MFAELYIENLALIEKTLLLWQPGLNVLSGETGAGKSMLLDAVSLLLGSRAGREQVRRGADKLRVQGVFAPPFSAGLQQTLAELGLEIDPEEELILSREVLAEALAWAREALAEALLSCYGRPALWRRGGGGAAAAGGGRLSGLAANSAGAGPGPAGKG